VAYAVGRAVGTAVARNRLRRRLRAIVSERAERLPAGAYLVRAGPEAAGLGSADLRTALVRALERAVTAETPAPTGPAPDRTLVAPGPARSRS